AQVRVALMCFFFQAEDGIRDGHVTGVQTCALPISSWNCAVRWKLRARAVRRQASSGQRSSKTPRRKRLTEAEWPGGVPLATRTYEPLPACGCERYGETATRFPVSPGPFRNNNSGFPGSVCTLQSKITYCWLTAVTRSAA